MFKFHRIAAGDYETEDGRYRLFQSVGVNPPAWNVEAIWTDEEREAGVDLEVIHRDSENVVEGAASYRDAKWFFERDVAAYDERRRSIAENRIAA